MILQNDSSGPVLLSVCNPVNTAAHRDLLGQVSTIWPRVGRSLSASCITNALIHAFSSFTAFFNLRCYQKGEKRGECGHPCTACCSPAKDKIAACIQHMKNISKDRIVLTQTLRHGGFILYSLNKNYYLWIFILELTTHKSFKILFA